MKNSTNYSLITATILMISGCGGGGGSNQTNIPPIANNDSFTITKNTTSSLNLQDNDHESDGTIVGQTIVTQPIHGTISSTNNSMITYTPNNNYVGTDNFTYQITDNESAVSNIATVNIIVNEGVTANACSELTTGLYAYEHWKTYGSPTDNAYVYDSEIKEIKLDSSNEIHWKSDFYTFPANSTLNWDSRGSTLSNTGGPYYIIDITNLTRTSVHHPVFPSTKTSCNNNIASFSRANGMMTWDMTLNYTDISGSFILDYYPDFEVEINDDINNKTKVFPSGSKLLVGNFIFTSNPYTMGKDSRSIVTDANGNSLVNIDFNNIIGQVLKFDGGQTMTLNSTNTFTFTDQNNANSITGTWQVLGTAPNQYIETIGSARDSDDYDLFFAVINGELRFGEKTIAGEIIPFGTTATDIMDDIMFNKTASDAILNYINNADTDNDGIINSLDNDIDGDGVLNANDAFPLNSAETIDTDNDGIGDNTDTDIDGDGVLNANDAFPLDSTETTDFDGDGIGNNADTDDDNDGLSDADEITYGTNPLDTDSDNDGLLDNYEVTTSYPNSLGNGISFTNPTIIDSDGDGVSDGYEVNFTNTNPTFDDLVDTDGDGLDDQVEVVLGTSPTNTTNGSADANLDSDGDGISNYVEVYGINNNFYTNPLMSDTDGDLLSDYFETTPYHSNPMTADTDNDGTNDNTDNFPLDPNQQ